MMASLKDAATGAATVYVICSLLKLKKSKLFLSVLAGAASSFLSRAVLGLKRELYPLEAWIDSGKREKAIEPARPMIDPHHHLWDPRMHNKGWPINIAVVRMLYKLKPAIMTSIFLNGSLKDNPAIVTTFSKFMPLMVPYMINEMLRDIKNAAQGSEPLNYDESNIPSHNIKGTVYIECGWIDEGATEAMKSIGEAAMAQEVAKKTNNLLCTGIVGHVPLEEGAAECRPALESLVRYPNVRGIRDSLASSVHEHIFSPKEMKAAYNPKFREAFALLKEYDLSYDCWLYQENIADLRDLALAFPETTIICDHVGNPIGIEPVGLEKSFETWKPLIKDLADQCPNVMCKLSGLAMATTGFDFHLRKLPPTSHELAEAWRPYILHCIDCFGVDRCMFASNFPVDKISCSYTNCFNAFKLIVKDFGEEEKHKLFYQNAVRIYRLNIADNNKLNKNSRI
mmetsp:Transcript_4039/g.4686  ORF Transcript_4039/g.4686 Transcript_4039/m.4686 type:complete len:454 (-) Transcript_4039:102-1463(-)